MDRILVCTRALYLHHQRWNQHFHANSIHFQKFLSHHINSTLSYYSEAHQNHYWWTFWMWNQQCGPPGQWNHWSHSQFQIYCPSQLGQSGASQFPVAKHLSQVYEPSVSDPMYTPTTNNNKKKSYWAVYLLNF